jgi:diguanylate cyclase (GGDEF)-like protein
LELLGDINYATKNYNAALEIYLKIQNAVDEINRVLLKEAYCYFFLGETPEAATICDSLYALPEYREDSNFKTLYDSIQDKNKKKFQDEHPNLNIFQKVFLRFFDRQITKTLTSEVQHERRMNLMKRKLYTDVLTNINNRVCFDEKIKPKFQQNDLITLMLFDIDKFKSVNDVFGHDAGDEVLKKYAAIGKEVFGAEFFRIGGEEFTAVHFGPKDEAFLVAEKFRKLVNAELATRVNTSKKLAIQKITCSGGIAEYPKEGQDYDVLFKLADNRLYYAKEHGRNQVIQEGQGLIKENLEAKQIEM